MSSTSSDIVFPAVRETSMVTVPVTPPPETPVNAGLRTIATQPPAQAQRELNCTALLRGDLLAKAHAQADRLYAEMFRNTAVLTTWGSGELEGVNRLIDELLDKVKPVRAEELRQLMRRLNDGMHGIRSKYDISQPDVRRRYERWGKGIFGFLHSAEAMVRMFREDITSIQSQLDNVAKQVRGREEELTRYVTYYDALYERNELELQRIIVVIAVLELIRDKAIAEAGQITVGETQLGDRGGEQKARIAQFVENINIRIANLKSRLSVAWATSPSLRMMREIDVTVTIQLDNLITSVIPTMKATLLQWEMMLRTEDAARIVDLVNDAMNEWQTVFFQNMGQTLPRIVDTAEKTPLKPQTIAAMVTGVQQATDGIIAAMDRGAQRRRELDDAIVIGHEALTATTAKLSDAIIERTVGAATRPLDIVTSVPAVGGATTN